MSNPIPAAESQAPRRSKFLPVVIGGFALAGALVATAVARPGNSGVPEKATVGLPAPDFELDSTDGTKFKLSAQRGHEVLLVFFRTHT